MARHLALVGTGLLSLSAMLGPVGAASGADAEPSLEYPVKAAFLLNFAKFAEWPADSPKSQAPQVLICVLGNDPFGQVLDRVVEGRAVGGRPVIVKRYQSSDGVQACHVLFIASSESGRLAKILERLAGASILTVGESDDFVRKGGIIGLVVEGNLARFEVNLRAAQREGLLLSSKLLSVARVRSTPAAREP